MSSTARSPEASLYHAWYNTARWRSIRRRQLASEPLCRFCIEKGQIVVATVCDHAEPHRGDQMKFWNGPFQSLCDRCHNGDKQSEERTGRRRRKGSDLEGWPLDPQHPWNEKR